MVEFKTVISDSLKQDLSDFFSMALVNNSIDAKIGKFRAINPHGIRSIDELIEALELYDGIRSHFESHLLDKKKDFEVDSPLKILGYLKDITKTMPDD